MLTIAGGIVLGVLALGVIGWLFGGESEGERLIRQVRRIELEADDAERRLKSRIKD